MRTGEHLSLIVALYPERSTPSARLPRIDEDPEILWYIIPELLPSWGEFMTPYRDS